MFEPRIVCFFCKWCTYAGADLAGTSRKQYPPNGVVVRVNCSGRIDPQHVLWAFREGADGVLIGGCHPGDCHYQDGNYKTMRRVALLKRMLEDMGIDPARLHLEWISAAEGDKLVHVIGGFVDEIRGLGPLGVEPTAGGRGLSAVPARPAIGAGRTQPAAERKRGAKKAPKKAVKKAAAGVRKTTKKAAGTKKAAKKAPARKPAGAKAARGAKAKKSAAKPSARKRRAVPTGKISKKKSAPKAKSVRTKTARAARRRASRG
jgi:F420-non-reducing hydrogenase iron-sulfur subunit